MKSGNAIFLSCATLFMKEAAFVVYVQIGAMSQTQALN